MNRTLKCFANISSAFVLASVIVISWASAQAEEEHGWIGALGGLSIPNASNTTSRLAYGITGGAKLGSEWGIGAYFVSSAKDESALGQTFKFNYDLYGVELAYHFEGEALGAYVGGRVGTSKVTTGTGASQVNSSPSHFGAVAGYNHFIDSHFSVGGEIAYFTVSSSDASSGFTDLNFLASAKLWF